MEAHLFKTLPLLQHLKVDVCEGCEQ